MPSIETLLPYFVISGALMAVLMVACMAVYIRTPLPMSPGGCAFLVIGTTAVVMWLSIWSMLFMAPDPEAAKQCLPWMAGLWAWVAVMTGLVVSVIDRTFGGLAKNDSGAKTATHEPMKV